MRILPLEKNPWIQTYQLRNYELGILQDKQPWIFSKYINIYYDQKKFNHLMLTGRYFEEENVMHVQKFRFDKSIVSFNVIDFVEWAKKLVEDGWYIYGFLDEYYLEAKAAFQKRHFRHPLLLYGFDETLQLFYAIGYVANGNYESFTVSFEAFQKAFWADFDREKEPYVKTSIDKIEFDAFRLNPDFEFRFDIRELYQGIDDYLKSRNPKKNVIKNCVFGIQCERYFIRYIAEEKGKEHSYLDPRFSRFFMEMKDFMLKRLEFLSRDGYIETSLAERYRPIVAKQNMIHMLFLKYNATQKQMIIDNLISQMSDIIEEETEVLLQVRDCLLKKIKEEEGVLYC